MLTVIRDTAGNFYIVNDSTVYEQAFVATPAKKTKSGFVLKANAKERLVRKDGCELVA